ncbi:Ras-related protein RABC1 [Morella rubra]|uniref:Ras-related protein RABC1 n=1 Tax=Morella rubra TaxID=262757 RepID=A0A6A1WRG7_9ROSI|nr:Ras-related protein RABC1 [Morella rubra]
MDTAAGEKKMKKETSTASSGQAGYDHLLKLLMIGDTWAGKSTLVVRYTSNTFQNLFATIGVLSISLIFPLFQCVDFKVKHATIGGKKLRLIICDAAGQERFRKLTSSYYRGAQGILMGLSLQDCAIMDTAAGEKKMKKETSTASSGQAGYDHLLKLLMIGDTWAGKSTLVVRYTNTFQNLFATIGVDFKVKHATIGGKKLRLSFATQLILQRSSRDTNGNPVFNKSSYCVKILVGNKIDKVRNLVLQYMSCAVYYITRRENFTNLSDIWAKEIDLYSTNQDCVKILVGNKIDKYCSICHVGSIISRKDVRHGEVNLSFQESERVVSEREGIDFARQNGYLFMECSAKTGVNEEKCFEQLVDKILEIPSLMAGTAGVKKSILKLEAPQSDASTSAKH